ncbi:hypothetical protein SRABI76_01385 [Microbacterium oxydans]|uniref:alpha/beta hydrolase domain-containing protein n=1 Tax=Microbacterium oxydans TaxID=82380 RepID=UPI001D30DAC0|nr:alpha/beta hydrolase domain-containing protein [Microbacterium oxydans]CAH0175300.1 hypothetical protein SRABI76_01385 [Microbacterium oxydans]
MSSHPLHLAPLDGARPPFGAAFDAEFDLGLSLPAHGYEETEHLLTGSAGTWRLGEPGAPIRVDTGIRYRTRILVRRPIDRGRSSGVTHVEPLHPHRDAGLSWDALAPHLLRRGDAWVGVTVYPHVAGLMRERLDPDRYAALAVPGGGTEWDIVSDVLELVRSDAIGDLRTTRIVLSGWSATGSFCRVFARERFATARGGLADAAAIFISSGGAGAAGYPSLTQDERPVDPDDPRRTIRDAGIPVFEILSETESETHRAQLREDSDEPGDTYRLYQIAGAAHIESWSGARSTQARTLAAAGFDGGGIRVREQRSDARSDLIARALMDHLIDAVDDPATAPRAPRFEYSDSPKRPAETLRRDDDDNVIGGIGAPWVQVPLATYAPHGTPTDEAEDGHGWTPLADRTLAAGLVGTMASLSRDEVLRRYRDEDSYRGRFEQATRDLVECGLLLAEDAGELNATAPARWRAVV